MSLKDRKDNISTMLCSTLLMRSPFSQIPPIIFRFPSRRWKLSPGHVHHPCNLTILLLVAPPIVPGDSDTYPPTSSVGEACYTLAFLISSPGPTLLVMCKLS